MGKILLYHLLVKLFEFFKIQNSFPICFDYVSCRVAIGLTHTSIFDKNPINIQNEFLLDECSALYVKIVKYC